MLGTPTANALDRHAEPPRDLHRLPDDQLLSLFFRSRESAAFETLLKRYGPLVYSVCRRVLKDINDVEDAFQAAFLVLVRKGGTLHQPGRLASWLYGVAYRTARHVKTKAAIRNRTERAAEVRQTTNVDDLKLDDLRKILDEEIGHLPEKYALPLVLVYLEGMSNAEAAAQLGWPEGSISRRLSRARELLRSRLVKRGMSISAALIAAVFARPAPAVPAELADATIEAATLSAQGAPLAELVSPAAAQVVVEVIAALTAPSYLVVAALALTVITTFGVIGWEIDLPTRVENYFYPLPPPAAANCQVLPYQETPPPPQPVDLAPRRHTPTGTAQ